MCFLPEFAGHSGILNNSFDIEMQKSYNNVVMITLKEKKGDGKIQTY